MDTAKREAVARRFGRNLFHHRRAVGLSQAALGRLAGVHRTEISMLERGMRSPRLETLVSLANSLEVPVEKLLKGIKWLPDLARWEVSPS
jgi:transcriptional regulator with XRE-family HTH domain